MTLGGITYHPEGSAAVFPIWLALRRTSLNTRWMRFSSPEVRMLQVRHLADLDGRH